MQYWNNNYPWKKGGGDGDADGDPQDPEKPDDDALKSPKNDQQKSPKDDKPNNSPEPSPQPESKASPKDDNSKSSSDSEIVFLGYSDKKVSERSVSSNMQDQTEK